MASTLRNHLSLQLPLVRRGVYLPLYVVLDLYSRFVVPG